MPCWLPRNAISGSNRQHLVKKQGDFEDLKSTFTEKKIITKNRLLCALLRPRFYKLIKIARGL
jgi:hypothetical protein